MYTIPNTCFRDPFTFTGSEKLNKRVSCNKRFAPLALEHENYFLGSTLPQQHKNTSQKTGRRFQTLAPPQWLPALPKLPVRLFLSPAGRAFIISLSLWLLAFLYCRQHFWHDPHSAFFSSEHIYDLKYSAFRQLQAESFIASTKFTNRTATVSRHPEICAAFVTVKRETKQYIDAAVGSLLEGLTVEEGNCGFTCCLRIRIPVCIRVGRGGWGRRQMKWGVMLSITKLFTICGLWKRKGIGMRREFCQSFLPWPARD